MAHLSLNKSSLTRQKRQLNTYEQFLPSLDMKRKQLIVEQGNARRELMALRRKLEAMEPKIAETIPMLADEQIDLTDLLIIQTGVSLGEGHQYVALPDSEGVIGVETGPPAGAALGIEQHRVDTVGLDFPLPPVPPLASYPVG